MTDLHRDPADPVGPARPADPADAAVDAADIAARAAGVQIREIRELAELHAVYRLYADIWRPEPKNPPITTELLRALSKAGNYVAAAFDGAELVGACVGFFGAPADEALHSHIAGVAGTVRGRNIGFALKLHQRAWSLLRGVSAIAWTYDPLVRRNAYFNLVKLAARPTEYLPNFYGGMLDAINGGDDSDRLLVQWTLSDPAVEAACAGRPPVPDAKPDSSGGAVIALGVSPLGGPAPGSLDAETLRVAVPADIERLRVTDPGAAKDWRVSVREVLGELLADGATVTGFDRGGWYVLHRPTTSDPTLRETPR